jgi:23S rRNA (guanine745-N1)-methyltransferase
MSFAFTCPLDGSPLLQANRTLRCHNGHAYDLAREGYVNLLPVQFKASKDPGDNREMVAARRRFLDRRYYVPIAERLRELVGELTEPGALVVDAGCGDGYYLDALAQAGGCRYSGFDISKWAVQTAAKRNPEIRWAVASNKRLPYPAGSVDLILCLFGFPVWSSFRAAQAAGGRALLVDPGPGHLRELREIIYPEVRATAAAPIREAEAAGYRLEKESALGFRFTLTSQPAIQDLLAMTPHGHRMPEAGRTAIGKVERLEVSAEVVFRILASSN